MTPPNDSSNGEDKSFVCVMQHHSLDLKQLRDAQVENTAQTGALVLAQKEANSIQSALTGNLEHLNQSLDSGVEMIKSVIALFGKIVFVFLVTVIILALLIVWIARLDINYDHGVGSIRSNRPTEKSGGPNQ